MGRKTNGRLLLDWLKDHKEFNYLLEEWDTERNREELGLEIEDVSYGTKRKVYWICKECGSSFLQAIGKRTGGDMCNECNKLYNWVKKHQEYQYLFEEFDYEKNKEELGIDIKDLTYGSRQKVYWRCGFCGKQYQKSVQSYTKRDSLNHGCELCNRKLGRKKAVKSYCEQGKNLRDWCKKNDRQYLLEEFDYEKNMDEFMITPDNITYASNIILNWICKKCKTTYKARLADRTTKSSENCPRCNKPKRTSFSEQAIYFYIKQVFPDAINSYKPDWLKPSEIDVYIPKLNLGIEFDGRHWHQESKRDLEKNNLLKEYNISIIRVREDACPILLDKGCMYIYTNKYSEDYTYTEDYLYKLFKYINEYYNLSLSIDINLNRDSANIRYEFMNKLKERSLVITHPEIAKDWNFDRNKNLKPEQFSHGSHIKVWWKCSEYGEEYEAIISNRVKYGCYYCNKMKRNLDKYKIWFNKYVMIKEYYMFNENLLIIKNKSYLETKDEKIDVYDWILKQRIEYRQGRLSDEQINKLKELEPIWNRNRKGSIFGNKIKANKVKESDRTRELERLWNKSNEIFMSSDTEKANAQKWTKIKYVDRKGVEKKDVWKEEKVG